MVGPTQFQIAGTGDSVWGIQFTALQDRVLRSFDYHHRSNDFGNPFSGTITLKDITSNTIEFTYNYPTSTPTVLSITGVDAPLAAGHVYQLLATSSVLFGSTYDEVFEYSTAFGYTAPVYPASNADISVTQGIFNGNTGFQEANAWGAFSNLLTTPE